MPASVDASGVLGPTRGQAQRSLWRRTSPGKFVPSHVPQSVEQRIVEAAAGVSEALVTGWGALRLYGGGFFDGIASDGRSLLDVPLLVPQSRRPSPSRGRRLIRVEAMPRRHHRFGIPVTSPERSVIEAARAAPTDRQAVIAVDMAVAAGITTIAAVDAAICDLYRIRGLPQARKALSLADPHCRSPQESRLRLIWVLDTGFPPPLMNRGVWTRSGELIGVPDLLDAVAGVAGEYDGAFHRDRSRHRRDVARAEAFRSVGLETFTVVAGDSPATVVHRMKAARSRALWLPAAERLWTLEAPGASGPQLDQDGQVVKRSV